MLAGLVIHPAKEAKKVLKFYQEYTATVPDELGSFVFLRTAPKAPFLPEHVHDTHVVIIGICYAGPLEEGKRVVQPLREFGQPLVDTIGPMSYKAFNAVWIDKREADEHMRWAREFFASTEPFSTGGVYVNFLGNEGEKRVVAAYGEAKYERLVALKNKYDPANFFRKWRR